MGEARVNRIDHKRGARIDAGKPERQTRAGGLLSYAEKNRKSGTPDIVVDEPPAEDLNSKPERNQEYAQDHWGRVSAACHEPPARTRDQDCRATNATVAGQARTDWATVSGRQSPIRIGYHGTRPHSGTVSPVRSARKFWIPALHPTVRRRGWIFTFRNPARSKTRFRFR